MQSVNASCFIASIIFTIDQVNHSITIVSSLKIILAIVSFNDFILFDMKLRCCLNYDLFADSAL